MTEHRSEPARNGRPARDALAKHEAERPSATRRSGGSGTSCPGSPWRRSTCSTPRTARRRSRTVRRPVAAAGLQRHVRARLRHRRLCRMHDLADGFDATTLLHLNKRDVTMICFSRAPIDRLTAYKERMGSQFPYVSTYETDFPWDFGLAMTEDQLGRSPRSSSWSTTRPSGRFWASQVGARSRTASARTRATSRLRRTTGPSTTPRRCRCPTRSSRRTSTSCSTGRRRNSRTSR